jgi:transcriptional regulator with XRE-family HTH domain
MTTEKKNRTAKSDAVTFLEKLAGGPLTFGRLMASIRLGEDESQTEFAKHLGISKAHLCDVEKDRRSVSPVRASQWAKKLGYDPEQFIELSIQSDLHKNGLRYTVKISPSVKAS